MLNNDKRKKLIAMLLAGSVSLISSGCEISEELGADTSSYDILENNTNSNTDNLNDGVEQILDVKNNDFKLVLNFIYNNPSWRITENKTIYMSAKTMGLPNNLEVYIDNIHADTSVISSKAMLDGILQDSMDDRIHNSLMMGFPISDTNEYYGCNSIEGMNQTFIQGFMYGCNGYSSGSVSERRFTEEDFLKRGVWANRIDTVIDLIIRDKNTNEISTVSVNSVLLVEANKTIKYSDGQEVTFDKEGNQVKVLKKTNNQ